MKNTILIIFVVMCVGCQGVMSDFRQDFSSAFFSPQDPKAIVSVKEAKKIALAAFCKDPDRHLFRSWWPNVSQTDDFWIVTYIPKGINIFDTRSFNVYVDKVTGVVDSSGPRRLKY
ncbi:MAG: hypothetical protein GY858_05965 [Candidatus Omnitrophica bacterium]|nr:hypothetical protein [Candidatus Omnitrophota bacterium]